MHFLQTGHFKYLFIYLFFWFRKKKKKGKRHKRKERENRRRGKKKTSSKSLEYKDCKESMVLDMILNEYLSGSYPSCGLRDFANCPVLDII